MKTILTICLIFVLGTSATAQGGSVADDARVKRDHEAFNEAIKGKKGAELGRAAFDFFMAHTDSHATLSLLQFYGMQLSADSVNMVYEALSPALKDSDFGRYLGRQLAAAAASAPGQPAPAFSKPDVHGRPISLGDFRGRYVLIDFWGSWCKPCRKSHPHLREVYARYHGKGLEIIGVAEDDKQPDAWKAAIAEDSIGVWHHVLGGFDQARAKQGDFDPGDIVSRYGINAFPTKVLIGPDGRILAKEVGSSGHIEAMLAELLD